MTPIAKLSARLDAKVIERAKADTPDADAGFLKRATPVQKRAWRKYSRLDDVVTDIVQKIIRSEATTHSDMLLKIRAAGLLVERENEPQPNPLAGLDNWQPQLSGYVCDDAAASLLALLREDLQRFRQNGPGPKAPIRF